MILKMEDKEYLKDKFISIAMPAYNEEKIIPVVVRDAIKVLRSMTPRYELLVVDDGSSDRTGKILDSLASKDKHIRVIHFKANKGVGYANHVIYRKVKGDLLFWNASDNQIHMETALLMLPYLQEHDLVVGNRALRADSLVRRLSSGLFSKLLRVRFRIPVKDIDSVKAYRISSLKKIMPESKTAFIESELLIKAVRKKLRIIEIPIKHYPRMRGEAKGFRLRIIMPQLTQLFRALFRTKW